MAEKARLVGEWLGDGRYRVTGEVTLPVPPERARACLTEVASLRRWALGGKVHTRLTEERGRYVFTFRTSPSVNGSMYGETLVDEPRRVVRRYYDKAPGKALDRGTGQERTVEYVLEPTPAGTLVHCAVDAVVPGLGDRGGQVVARVEAESLAHSLDRLALFAAGRRPPLWWRAYYSLFPKSPMPV